MPPCCCRPKTKPVKAVLPTETDPGVQLLLLNFQAGEHRVIRMEMMGKIRRMFSRQAFAASDSRPRPDAQMQGLFSGEDWTAGMTLFSRAKSQRYISKLRARPARHHVFFLTRNEHNAGLMLNPDWRLAMVTSAVSDTPQVTEYNPRQLKEAFSLEPYVYIGAFAPKPVP